MLSVVNSGSEENNVQPNKADSVENLSNNEDKVEEVSAETDVYDYLNRQGFTSEKFKIEIRGLPKFYGINEFKKLLNEKLLLDCSKLKTIRPGSPWAFVCFRNEEDRTKALSVINGYKWKGKSLTAQEAKPAPDPLVKKRKLLASDGQSDSKKVKDDISQEEKLKNSTTPYWNKSYDEQLNQKQIEIKNILREFNYKLWKWASPSMKTWINRQKNTHSGLVCELLDIKPSPITTDYRNKCEFTIGIDCETNLPTVGFRLSSYDAGFIGVGPIRHLNHIPERMKIAAEIFQKFVISSNLTVFSPEDHSGHFRQLTARVSSFTDELMLIIGIHPQEMDESQLNNFKEELKIFFSTGDGKPANVNSLYLQRITKKISGEVTPELEHIMGETHIIDQINQLKFRISPEAFFQVNTPCAEVLYKQAIELSKPTDETTLLDICCGTGTIGLTFAKYCGKIIGLELVPQAVEDAKTNAAANGITNAEFHTGPAEDLLGSIIWALKGQKDVLAVVDPPRAGLHTRAITQLRRCPELKRLLYVSCNPRSAIKNWIDLARPPSKTMRGAPFLPVRAVAVDMFPQTKHCEFLMYFEREVEPPEVVVPGSSIKVEEEEKTENPAAENTEDAAPGIEKTPDGVEKIEASVIKSDPDVLENA